MLFRSEPYPCNTIKDYVTYLWNLIILSSVLLTFFWLLNHIFVNRRSRSTLGKGNKIHSRKTGFGERGAGKWHRELNPTTNSQLGNPRNLIGMLRQIIHINQIVNTSHNVERQALQHSWVALQNGLPHILKQNQPNSDRVRRRFEVGNWDNWTLLNWILLMSRLVWGRLGNCCLRNKSKDSALSANTWLFSASTTNSFSISHDDFEVERDEFRHAYIAASTRLAISTAWCSEEISRHCNT